MEKKIRSAEACVHCHLCRENCAFLEKYGIDIGDTEELRNLAYHCFLCGTCGRVCPKGIDGREMEADRPGKATGEFCGRKMNIVSGITEMSGGRARCSQAVISPLSTPGRPGGWRGCWSGKSA